MTVHEWWGRMLVYMYLYQLCWARKASAAWISISTVYLDFSWKVAPRECEAGAAAAATRDAEHLPDRRGDDRARQVPRAMQSEDPKGGCAARDYYILTTGATVGVASGCALLVRLLHRGGTRSGCACSVWRRGGPSAGSQRGAARCCDPDGDSDRVGGSCGAVDGMRDDA